MRLVKFQRDLLALVLVIGFAVISEEANFLVDSSYARVKRITNGLDPPKDTFKSSAAITLGYGKNNVVCGCVIIHPQWALTSVRCIDPTDLWSYRIRVFNKTQLVYVEIARVLQHGKYLEVNYTRQHDIMLVELAKTVDVSETLASFVYPVPETVIMVGYGPFDNHGQHEGILQYAEVPVISDRDCSKAFAGIFKPLREQICVGYDKGNVGPCGSDLGSPLYSKEGKSFVLMGIASMMGLGPCGVGPAVYTEIAHYLPWIKRWVYDVKQAGTRCPTTTTSTTTTTTTTTTTKPPTSTTVATATTTSTTTTTTTSTKKP